MAVNVWSTDSAGPLQSPALYGVNHVAFPTFDPAGTLAFYGDTLGLRLAHSVTATGWGPDDHPDFVHFFFDIGAGGRIAFFYYFGLEASSPPGSDAHSNHGPEVPKFFRDSRHLAFTVETSAELDLIAERLRSGGWPVDMRVSHETIESLYTRDPNGYMIEFSCATRELGEADERDAELTVRALVDVVADGSPTLADLWRRKAELVRLSIAAPSRAPES